MYPASRMPDFTIASAISRIIGSLTWFRNLFQLFQPIGGVLASPFDLSVSVGIATFVNGPRGARGSGLALDSRAGSTTCGARRPPGGGPPAPGAPPGPGPRPGPRPPKAGTVSFIRPFSIVPVYVT